MIGSIRKASSVLSSMAERTEWTKVPSVFDGHGMLAFEVEDALSLYPVH